jgi:hypothetical protein
MCQGNLVASALAAGTVLAVIERTNIFNSFGSA